MRLTFLGTGAAIPDGRLWSSLLVDGEILIDPSPTAPWALHRLGRDLARLRAILVTHVHADHTFGLPLLLCALQFRVRHRVPVIGPPGTRRWMRRLLRLAYPDVRLAARAIELAREVRLGPWRIRAIPMRHTVRAQGYLVTSRGVTLGYSGDTESCPGLRRLVDESDIAVVEMTSARRLPGHLTPQDVAALGRHVIATHVGLDRVPHGVRAARDLETVTILPRVRAPTRDL